MSEISIYSTKDYSYFEEKMLKTDIERIYPVSVINDLLEKGNNEYPEKSAVRWWEGERTYGEVYDDVAHVRYALDKLNIPKGAHIGVLMKNEYAFVKTFFAAITMGYIFIPIPLTLPPADIIGAVKRLDCKYIMYSTDMAPLANGIRPALGDVAFVGEEDLDLTSTLPARETSPEDTAIIVFTGGTTGKQKGAMLSQKALLTCCVYGVYGYEDAFEQSYFALIPFTHIFGLVRNFLTSYYTASSIYLCDTPKNMFRDLPKAAPTLMVLVPALAQMLLGYAKLKGMEAIGGKVKTIICGGAAVPPALIRACDAAGIALLPGYGLTESANLVSGNGDYLAHPDSVGMPYPGQELKFVDGELWLKGDNIMSGYYNSPEENANAFEDGYFKTGDLAKIGEDGLLYIVGRIKNIIILSNGENVSPEELEALVNAVPFVQDCLVFEGKNAVGEPTIAIEVFPNAKAAEAMGITDIGAAVKEAITNINRGLPSYKQMHLAAVRDTDFERNGSMKIIRNYK
ncbi:MAG: acyl--CoA ligase [Clostridiales bacterium]|nr:acyl--CoA ligase [Clostridiales bacterium]